MRYKMQTLLKIGLAGGICMSLIFFYAFHYSQNKQNVGQDQNPGSVQTDGDAEMFEKGAQHNEKIGKSGEQPEVTRNSDDPQPKITRNSDDPQPKVIKNSDDPQPKVIKNSDDPQPKVIKNSDDPQPKVTGNSDDPQPKVTGNSDDPQPKVTGHSDDPQPEITRNSDDPQPKVTGNSDDPQPKVTGNSDDPQPKVTGHSDDPQPKVIEHSDDPQPKVTRNSDDPQPKVPKQSESKLDKKELKEKSNDEGHEKEKKHEEEKAAATSESIEDRMHLAVVACGDRLEETLVMMKSAIIMSEAKLHFHIFSDDNLQEDFKKQQSNAEYKGRVNAQQMANMLNTWPAVKKKTASYSIYPITFPLGNEDQWRKLFKPCATQRLFLPSVLPKVDSLLYIDTDVLFMQPVDQIWSHFHHFNSSHISALAPEHEDSHVGWYNRFARHPYYPPLGVNSGVMLMNLTRMREAKWLDHIVPYYEEYRYRITWGDQDLINIFFHFFPEKLYVYPCEWNYRPDHCMYMSVCKTAEQYGVRIVHGNRGVYHNEKQLAFRAIYETLRDHPFEKSKQELSESIKRNMAAVKPSNCGKVGHIFTKALDEYIRDPKNKDKTLETKR